MAGLVAFNKRRTPSTAMIANPKRATAEPPSGKAAVLALKPNRPDAGVVPLLEIVKLQVPAVGVKPFPEIVPNPAMFRKVEDCITTVELSRLKLNPPTVHNGSVFVEGLKT